MRREKDKVQPADEIGSRHHEKAAMAQRLRERVAHRRLRCRRHHRKLVRRTGPEGRRQHRGGEDRKEHRPDLPGVVFQHTLGRERHDERTERADCRDHTKHLAAAPLRHRPGASRQRQGGGRTRQRDANQHTRDDQGHLAAGGRHRRETGDINHGPRDQSNAQPEAVRNRASRRLRQTPDDILDGDGQREIRRGERQITRHRRQKQADTLPQTHADA